MIANSQGWNLSGNEQLLGGALLQLPNGNVIDNFVVSTTTNGRDPGRGNQRDRLCVRNLQYSLGAGPVLDPVRLRHPELRYRHEFQTGRVYVTDRNFCQALALGPAASPFTALVNDGDVEDLTLRRPIRREPFQPVGRRLRPASYRSPGGLRRQLHVSNERGRRRGSVIRCRPARHRQQFRRDRFSGQGHSGLSVRRPASGGTANGVRQRSGRWSSNQSTIH